MAATRGAFAAGMQLVHIYVRLKLTISVAMTFLHFLEKKLLLCLHLVDFLIHQLELQFWEGDGDFSMGEHYEP